MIPMLCDGCGKPIEPWEGYHYVPNARTLDGKRYHIRCTPKPQRKEKKK